MSVRVLPRWEEVRARLDAYVRLVRLDRPIGIWLLLWPTLWALWIAGEGRPEPRLVLIFTLGVVLMRSAGCAINDWADRGFDPHVARTRTRPLAAGEIAPGEALAVFALLALLAFGLVLLTNRLTILLSLAAAALAATYPFAKRWTWMPQVHLGAAFGFAVPMAFAAQTGAVPRLAWLLFVVTLLWAVIYDTMYAMADREDDRRIGVRSTALLFGEADRLILAVLQGVFLLGLLLVGRLAGLDGYYHLGLAVAAALFLYQQYLIRDRDPAACIQAFLNNHWLGMAVFVAILLDYLGRG
ncbi:4-hydroxybenzoate polyprenyltransferase [Inmirania thermothiophila]|uniref:4-hydroxybenzoate octaprenyltransferase n=1 Tax=Inmirania thermothiophila TaxID=1750597 RepID=A0A3N1Y6X4_9GAMM|nr:4-hydroxybenzoate polyprenyltransferase [Inmirania thermothiophila]